RGPGRYGGSSRRRPRSREQLQADRTAAHTVYRKALRRERRHRACRIPSRQAVAPGSVLRAQVNYEEGIGCKVRPVVVVDGRGSEVLVVPFTTKPGADSLRISDPSAAGLKKETWCRRRPIWLARSAFIERLGRLTRGDFNRALSVAGARHGGIRS